MPPANERLDAPKFPAPQVHDRLIVELKFVLGDTSPDLGFELNEVHTGRIEIRFEDFTPSSPACLGPVHGHVRMSKNVLRLCSLPAECDPDAGRDDESMAFEFVRGGERFLDMCCNLTCIRGIAQPRD